MKIGMIHISAVVGVALGLAPCASFAQAAPQFHVEHKWTIGGDQGWDYLKIDPAANRLYIARGNRVQVVDTRSGKLLAEIGGMEGTHGVALDTRGKYGYVSDGKAGIVRKFDRATLKVVANIPAQENPDAIIFDPATDRVFAFNGSSHSATVIDTNTDKVVATIPLPGKPEFAQSDAKGNVFVNIEDKNQIVRIDAHAMKTTATWPIAPCDSPSGLAIDRANHRLFSVCDNKVMIVVNDTTGKVVATPAIGDGPDATRYDAKRHLVLSSNGHDGTLTVVQQRSPDSYIPVQSLTTQPGARTLALDARTGTIYVVTAERGAPPAATAANPHPRPAIKPNSFVIIAIGTKGSE